MIGNTKAVYAILAAAVLGFAASNLLASDFFDPGICLLGGNNSPLGGDTAAPPSAPGPTADTAGAPGGKTPDGTKEPGVEKPPAPELLAVKVDPGSAELSIGESRSFSATAIYSDNSARAVTGEAAWDPGSAFTATAAGSFTVTATYRGRSGSASLTVKEPAVTALAVSPEQSEIKAGVTVAFSASASFEDGSSRDVTAESAWSPASSFTGREPGTFTVSAAFKGVTGTARVTVQEPQVSSLALSPAKATVKPGGSVSFTATASFEDGSSRDVTVESTWNPASTFTGSQAGEFSVTAGYRGRSASASVRVEDLGVTGLAVSPATTTIKLNESVGFKAVATLEDGSTRDVTSESAWAPGSSFTGTQEGAFQVAATYKGQQASAAVTVEAKKKTEEGSAPPPAGKTGYDPTRDPGMPAGTPGQTARAGQEPGPSGGGNLPGPGTSDKGGRTGTDQGPYADTPGKGGEEKPQPPPGGAWCYSEKTGQQYMIPYGPCPPPSMGPPAGSPTWQGQVEKLPPKDKKEPQTSGKPMGPKSTGTGSSPPAVSTPAPKPSPPPTGGGGCGPGTSCKCAGGATGHISCDTGKCHCGGG